MHHFGTTHKRSRKSKLTVLVYDMVKVLQIHTLFGKHPSQMVQLKGVGGLKTPKFSCMQWTMGGSHQVTITKSQYHVPQHPDNTWKRNGTPFFMHYLHFPSISPSWTFSPTPRWVMLFRPKNGPKSYVTCWAPKLTKNVGASLNLFEHLIRHHNKAIPHTFELNLHVFSKTSLLVGKSKMLCHFMPL